jgi:hypothetical protein
LDVVCVIAWLHTTGVWGWRVTFCQICSHAGWLTVPAKSAWRQNRGNNGATWKKGLA